MNIVKRGWTGITSGRMYNLYVEVINHAKELNLWPQGKTIPLLFTRKSIGTFGACFNSRNEDGSYDCSIVLNELLGGFSDDQIRKTIVHEVAHAIHPRDDHGYHWWNTANTIGKKWGYKVERLCNDKQLNDALNKHKKPRVYKYELYCPVCGASWKYQRMCDAVRHPQRYQCWSDKSLLCSREIGEGAARYTAGAKELSKKD